MDSVVARVAGRSSHWLGPRAGAVADMGLAVWVARRARRGPRRWCQTRRRWTSPPAAVRGGRCGAIHTSGRQSGQVGRCVDVNASTTTCSTCSGVRSRGPPPGGSATQERSPFVKNTPIGHLPSQTAATTPHVRRTCTCWSRSGRSARTQPRTISSSPRDAVSCSTRGGNRRVVVNRSTMSSGAPPRGDFRNQLKRSPHSSAAGTVRHGPPGDIRTSA